MNQCAGTSTSNCTDAASCFVFENIPAQNIKIGYALAKPDQGCKRKVFLSLKYDQVEWDHLVRSLLIVGVSCGVGGEARITA